MNSFLIIAFSFTVFAHAQDTFAPFQEGDRIPQTVTELWENYDPTLEPLNKEVVATFKEDGVVCEYVLFTVATFQGTPSRIAAYYTYPDGGKNLPAFVWAHGGGQRAEKERGFHFAKKGFATVDINWNGREMEPEIEQNTDWGKIDPTQGPRFYPKSLREGGHHSFAPDPHTVDPVSSPRNPHWFMLAVAGRRAITFLEQQEEVNSERIGFTGFSMGGNITGFCAIDRRLKAVVPIVGGTGYLSEKYPGYPQTQLSRRYDDWYGRTIDNRAYWPLVTAPVMFISGSNDFHGRFSYMQQCVDSLPHDEWRISQTLHNNHNPENQQWLALEYWFDHYLKKEPATVPATPDSSLSKHSGNEWVFKVSPAEPEKVKSVRVFYSWDSCCSNRYHKFVAATREGNTWVANIPSQSDLPLTAFADVTYPSKSGEAEEALRGLIDEFSITSTLYQELPDSIAKEMFREDAGYRKFEPIFAEFPKDNQIWGVSFRDEALLTYKFNDYALKFPREKKLKFVVDPADRKLSLSVLFFSQKHLDRSRDEIPKVIIQRKNFTSSGELVVSLADLVSEEGEALTSWHNLSSMKVTLTDFGKKEKVDLLSSEDSGKFLKRIEWVD